VPWVFLKNNKKATGEAEHELHEYSLIKFHEWLSKAGRFPRILRKGAEHELHEYSLIITLGKQRRCAEFIEAWLLERVRAEGWLENLYTNYTNIFKSPTAFPQSP
jgi:hypothetical protein